jgi:hypothetical protein
MQEGGHFLNNMPSRAGSSQHTPSPTSGSAVARSRQHARRSVIFRPALQVHRYPPAVWGDDEEEDDDDEWDVGGYEDEDPALAEEAMLAEQERRGAGGGDSDDGMSWEEALPDPTGARALAAAEEQRRQQELHAQQLQQQQFQQRQDAEDLAAQLQQQQQQRQQIEEQRRQQQIMAQSVASQAPDTVTQRSAGLSIHTSNSREQLVPPQETSASSSPSTSSTSRSMDPADASETKKISMTPLVAQDNNQRGQALRQPQPRPIGPMLPSEVMHRQEEVRKRTREEIEALEEAARKKAKSPPNGRTNGGPAKLRKEPQSSGDEDSGRERDKKGKSSGLFGRLFDRRKDKHKEKGQNDSIDTTRSIDLRGSEESGRSSNHTDSGTGPQTPPRRGMAPITAPSPVSQHATSLRQRDREQQALYQQQYLTRSPASPPEAHSSFQTSPGSPGLVVLGLGNASSTLSPSIDGRRPRPGSLLIGGNISGDGSSAVPELSVIRVFAGKKLQTEATFKTVLLNSLTSSEELVKQAIQRFRLPAGEDATDYYLTVKRVEGSSAVLRPNEKPLIVFETLAEAALDLPKVKRSSMGSISSIASNLSQHPAIKKLPMNDFTDDTAVKIYLNHRSESGSEESTTMEEGDTTISAESVLGDEQNSGLRLRPQQYLNTSGVAVPSERFSSPSFRFALQLMIYPDDLPDDMVFDPLTEAIVFKHTLRDRPQVLASSAPFRRKIFVFPKNITVAEVIEIALERFGIAEGVVDGGDEVEDKNTKRRSSSRVRYALNVLVEVDGKGWWRPFFRCPLCSYRQSKERELTPPGKVIDAYPRPPTYRPADRRSIDSKRRSLDSMMLLGSPEDVNPEDPVFILRRAVTYRTSSSRHRLSAPLDEIALQQLHRESLSSSSNASEDNDTKQRHISKQELIAAQRAATRANQRAIVSAQTNSQRGVDVFLPNNAVLRSSRYDTDERTRYSYVEGGETYDISDIMEEEWDSSSSGGQGDLLEGVLSRASARDGVDEKLHRVLSKIKDSRTIQRTPSSPPNSASTVDSVYSNVGQDGALQAAVERSRSATPVGADKESAPRAPSPASERTVTPDFRRRRSGTSSSASHGRSTPQQQLQQQHLRQISIASLATDTSSGSGYRTAVGSPSSASASPAKVAPRQRKPKVTLPKDDFGVSHMMAIIELSGLQDKPAPLPPLHPVDEMLFGRPLNLDELHPAIKEIYAPTLKQLDEMGQVSAACQQHLCVCVC